MISLVSSNPAVPGAADKARRALLGKVHIAVKALGMLDDDYRALLHRVTGKRSAGDCDRRQLDAVVAEFERLGFTGKAARPDAARATHPVAKKARAMWISLYQLGAIDDPSERALEAFGARQLGVDRLQWADQSQGFSLIEALKGMANRYGWDQRVPARMPARARIRTLKDRLVGAQLARLAAAGVTVTGRLVADRAEWPEARLPPADLPGDAVPDWLHLLPAGEVRTTNGRGPYHVADPAALIAASLASGKLALDENHATDLAGPRDDPSPARGWIVALEDRADGIWGRVEWTGTGRQLVADRAYRGVSPVIVHDAAGVIGIIRRASLTNTPNLVGLASLHSAMQADGREKVNQLDAADLEVIGKLGIDPAAYAVHKAALAG